MLNYIKNIFKKETIDIQPNPNRSRTFKNTPNGVSFVNITHMMYVENIMKKQRQFEGRELKELDMPNHTNHLFQYQTCFECEELQNKDDGEFVPIRQKDVDDFEESWVCWTCIDKDLNS